MFWFNSVFPLKSGFKWVMTELNLVLNTLKWLFAYLEKNFSSLCCEQRAERNHHRPPPNLKILCFFLWTLDLTGSLRPISSSESSPRISTRRSVAATEENNRSARYPGVLNSRVPSHHRNTHTHTHWRCTFTQSASVEFQHRSVEATPK